MDARTSTQIRAELDNWYALRTQLAKGGMAKVEVGGRQYTRFDLAEINATIADLEGKLEEKSAQENPPTNRRQSPWARRLHVTGLH